MIQNEIRDTIWIGITFILLAALLTFITFLFQVRSDFAEAKNNETVNKTALQEYSEFNGYDNTEVQGVDIISAIREYYNSGVRIGVKDPDGRLVYEVDETLAKADATLIDFDNLYNTFDVSKKYKAGIVYSTTYADLLDQVRYNDAKDKLYYFSTTEGQLDPNTQNDGTKVQAIVFFEEKDTDGSDGGN